MDRTDEADPRPSGQENGFWRNISNKCNFENGLCFEKYKPQIQKNFLENKKNLLQNKLFYIFAFRKLKTQNLWN